MTKPPRDRATRRARLPPIEIANNTRDSSTLVTPLHTNSCSDNRTTHEQPCRSRCARPTGADALGQDGLEVAPRQRPAARPAHRLGRRGLLACGETQLPPNAEKGPVGGIPAPSQDSSVAGGGIPLLRSTYIVHDFTASVKQFLPIAAIVDCDGTPPAERNSGDRRSWLVLRCR